MQELPHYGCQQMRLARTGRHLYHHIPMITPLFKEPELHLLLVITKMFVFAIHYADAGRYRQQWEERLHALLHTAYIAKKIID